ncbi:TPA: hypothetical protein DIC40_04985 [Patescibacteria group bacterium]|nr:hypothetical protein [Candidatus Gracilibacteria bacterium]
MVYFSPLRKETIPVPKYSRCCPSCDECISIVVHISFDGVGIRTFTFRGSSVLSTKNICSHDVPTETILSLVLFIKLNAVISVSIVGVSMIHEKSHAIVFTEKHHGNSIFILFHSISQVD